MEFECPPGTADRGTLLGMLQRGRGAGWLAAVRSPSDGREALLACLAHDPRLDHQVESRAEFYATLAMALHVEVREVIDAGAGQEDDWLVPEVLEALAERGVAAARESLGTEWTSDHALPSEWSLPVDHLRRTPRSLNCSDTSLSHRDGQSSADC